MDAQNLALVFTAYTIAAGSPGPSNMRIMAVAMHEGRKAGLAVAAGVVSGSIFWGALAATGVAAVTESYPYALQVLKVFGGLYLLYLAVKAAKSAASEPPAPNTTLRSTTAFCTLYVRGLFMHLTNPKSVLAWIALMTLGLGPGASSLTVATILAGCGLLSVCIFAIPDEPTRFK